jgi:DNA mismatch repair ATPase MutS
MVNKFSTENVENATSAYIGACEDARMIVRAELRQICDDFIDEHHLLTSIANVQLTEILLAMNLHAREFVRKGWTVPLLEEEESTSLSSSSSTTILEQDPIHLSLPNLHPYWLDKRSAVRNNIDLKGQWLLSGANMSGKSTLLRSVTAAALLANCGLAAPIQYDDDDDDGSSPTTPIPRLDGYFLRTNGSDCPSEGLSAFALEADDMRILLRDLTPRSLAAIDELGRGTSPQEGAAIVGAMLEEFDQRKCPSIFATHLQMELKKLPLKLNRTRNKVLEIIEDNNTNGDNSHDDNIGNNDNKKGTNGGGGGIGIKWTYKLKDGICEDAHSIATAREHKVPEYILNRAVNLRKMSNHNDNNTGVVAVDDIIAHHQEKNEEENGCKRHDDIPRIKKTTLNDIIDVLKNVLLTNDDGNNNNNMEGGEIDLENVIMLDPGWEPPPRIADGIACIYILKCGNGFYVGETESISSRISQHRRRFGNDITVGIIPIKENNGGRSIARYYESYFIDQLYKNGINLLNVRD